MDEVDRKRLRELRRAGIDAEVTRLRDDQSFVAAGVDRRKRRQIHVHVEAEAVIAATASDAQAERGDLGDAAVLAVDIDAGCPVETPGGDALSGKQVDDRLFDARSTAS